MAKRQYKTNKDYKSIAIRFNIKDKDEKKLFLFLNSMGSEDRTTFIQELYNKKGNIEENKISGKNEMSIYECRLFDIVEKMVGDKGTQLVTKPSAQDMTESIPNVVLKKGNMTESRYSIKILTVTTLKNY